MLNNVSFKDSELNAMNIEAIHFIQNWELFISSVMRQTFFKQSLLRAMVL